MMIQKKMVDTDQKENIAELQIIKWLKEFVART